jgi:co-chaperonin GroES (HSP10)
MIVTPLKKKVLVAENARETQTESGIILEGTQGYGDSKTGKVIAIGPDVTDVKVGDDIYMLWNKCTVVNVDGAQRVMIDEENIVAVLDK